MTLTLKDKESTDMKHYKYLKRRCVQQISVLIFFALILQSCSPPHRMAPHYERDMAFEATEVTGYLNSPTSVDASKRNSQNIDADTDADADAGERMVVYAVLLNLTVKNIEDAKKVMHEQIRNFKGYIVKETMNRVIARIPSKNMDNFLNNVKTLGEINLESKEGVDITDQYRDNTISLNSLKAVRDRYTALLEKAEKVNEILVIEKELERVNLQIEQLEGKIRYAEQSVSYSIITVDLRREYTPEPVKRTRPGPLGWVFYGLYHGIVWLFVWQ